MGLNEIIAVSADRPCHVNSGDDVISNSAAPNDALIESKCDNNQFDSPTIVIGCKYRFYDVLSTDVASLVR